MQKIAWAITWDNLGAEHLFGYDKLGKAHSEHFQDAPPRNRTQLAEIGLSESGQIRKDNTTNGGRDVP
jgi:hypothetical protein